VAAAIVAAALAACTSPGHAASPGTITGVAAPACVLPPAPAPRAIPPGLAALIERTTIYAQRNGRVVATKIVHLGPGGGHYRLTLPPGRYLIGSPQSTDSPRLVVLHSGVTITVNFTNTCLL